MRKVKYIISIFIGLILMLFVYTFLHEGGHAIVGLACGGKIIEYVLGFKAHVSIAGAEYTPVSESLLNVAGVLMPVCIAAIALLFYRSQVKSIFYHIFYATFIMGVAGSFLSFIVMPIMSMFTDLPSGDDVTRFLGNSKIHPLLVSLAAFSIFLALVILSYKKGIYKDIIQITKSIRNNDAEAITNDKLLLPFSILTAALILFFGVTIIVQNHEKPILCSNVSTEITADSQDILFPFKAEKSKRYNMKVALKNTGMIIDMQIHDENGQIVYQNLAENFNIECPIDLNIGKYTLNLICLTNEEAIQKHFKKMRYNFDKKNIAKLLEVYSDVESNSTHSISFTVNIK